MREVPATGIVTYDELRLARIVPPAHGRVEIIDAVFGEQVQAGQRLAVLEHGARPRLPNQELRRSWVKAWLRG